MPKASKARILQTLRKVISIISSNQRKTKLEP